MEGSKILQKTIKLEPHIESCARDEYFITTSNRPAYEAMFLERIGILPYINFLIIEGGRFSGKTSLSDLYMSSKDCVLACNLSDVLDKMGASYVIDDCDKWQENDLFHAINFCYEQKASLLLFAALSWKPSLPDLSSRINSIKQVDIQDPDDEMLEIVIASEFSKRSIAVNKEIISYLKMRVPRNFARIKEVIKGIDEFCLESKKNITIKTLSNFLSSK